MMRVGNLITVRTNGHDTLYGIKSFEGIKGIVMGIDNGTVYFNPLPEYKERANKLCGKTAMIGLPYWAVHCETTKGVMENE